MINAKPLPIDPPPLPRSAAQLESGVRYLLGVLGLAEWHEDEPITGGVDNIIKHSLRRVPKWLIVTGQDGAGVVKSLKEKWTRDQIVVAVGAADQVVSFILI